MPEGRPAFCKRSRTLGVRHAAGSSDGSPAGANSFSCLFQNGLTSRTGKQASPLQPPSEVSAEIFRIAGAKAAGKGFCSGRRDFPTQYRPSPAYTPPGTIKIREGRGPLKFFRVFSTVCKFPTAGIFQERQFPRRIFCGSLKFHRTNWVKKPVEDVRKYAAF